MSRQKTPSAQTRAEGLGAGLLSGEALGVAGGVVGFALRARALHLGEDAVGEPVAKAVEARLNAGGCRRDRSRGR